MKKRIFIAIDISVEARHKVFDYIEILRREFKTLKVGWERAENLHITLKFLGNVENEKIFNVIEIIEKISKKTAKFTSHLSKITFSPQRLRDAEKFKLKLL